MKSLTLKLVGVFACLLGCANPGGDAEGDDTGFTRAALRMLPTVYEEVLYEAVVLSSSANYCALVQQWNDNVSDHDASQPYPSEFDLEEPASAAAYCEARVEWVEGMAALSRPFYVPGSSSKSFIFDGEDGRVVRPGEYVFDQSAQWSVRGVSSYTLNDPYADYASIAFDCEAWALDQTTPLPNGPEWEVVLESLEQNEVVGGSASVEETPAGLHLSIESAPLQNSDGEHAGELSVDEHLDDCVYEPAGWGR